MTENAQVGSCEMTGIERDECPLTIQYTMFLNRNIIALLTRLILTLLRQMLLTLILLTLTISSLLTVAEFAAGEAVSVEQLFGQLTPLVHLGGSHAAQQGNSQQGQQATHLKQLSALTGHASATVSRDICNSHQQWQVTHLQQLSGIGGHAPATVVLYSQCQCVNIFTIK